MADRSRRVRRQISDATDESSEDSSPDSAEDYDPRKVDSMRRAGKPDASVAPAMSRPKRTSGGIASNARSGASVQRSSAGASDDKRQSLKLTVKAPPSKLREVMRVNEVESLHDTLGGGQVLDGPRSRRSAAAPSRTSIRAADRPRYAEYGESDIEDGDEEDEEEDEDENEEEEDDINDFDELGAEAEGGTDEEDEDVEMEDAPMPPKPPRITLKPPAKTELKQAPKPRVHVVPPSVEQVKSVEDQEMEDEPGDDEMENSSELSADNDEDDDDDDEEDEENTNINGEDVEGEEEELDEEDGQGEDEDLEDDEEMDDDEDVDSSDETPGSGSATPDLTKLTKRQRGRPEDSTTLMALDMAPQQRKFFTDAEKAMKKDEHARKRKELTKRKVQEEKTAALNRLLKPQASKARGAAPKPETLAAATAAAAGSSVDEDEYAERAHPLYTRWISTRDGVKLGVPEEWLGKRVGAVFGSPLHGSNGGLVQEVE